MTITKEELNNLMQLSRLRIEEKDTEELQQELSRILGLMDELRKVDTENVLPLANPCDDIQRLRKDEITESDQRAKWQKNAPAIEAGLYLVPKVVE